MTTTKPYGLSPEERDRLIAESLQVAENVRLARLHQRSASATPPSVLCRTPAGPRPVREVLDRLDRIDDTTFGLIRDLHRAMPYSLAELAELSEDSSVRRMTVGLLEAQQCARALREELLAQVNRGRATPPHEPSG